MTFFKNIVRAGAIALAILGGSLSAKPAQADGGAVVAGIAGGLILGTIIGSTANASNYSNSYYSAAPTYYAPAPRYYAPAPVYRPFYGPSVNFSFGKSFHGGKRHYGKRHFGGHRGRHFQGHRGHRGFHRGGRRH